MLASPRPPASSRSLCRAPLPVLVALAVLVAIGPVGLAFSRDEPRPRPLGPSLPEIARAAGCELTDFDHDPRSNPPVSGRIDERVSTPDGSYAGRRSPSQLASLHAMLHGRVLLQYRSSVPADQVRALDHFVRRDPRMVLLFANRTDMPHPIAATAYLSLMTCPEVNAGTLGALGAFRDRRGGFGQAF